MNCKNGKAWVLAAVFIGAAGFAAPATAQFYTGRIDVTLTDQTGGRVPGVNVDITGPVNQSAVSDAQGQAHFLNLPVGTYTVKAALSGFKPYENTNVPVVSGGAVPLEVRLSIASATETVLVTAESPVIDIKKTTMTTNVTLEELQNIPSARDPWVVMQTVPSIVVDRVNVGGSESGQQSAFNAKGAPGSANTWNLDGSPDHRPRRHRVDPDLLRFRSVRGDEFHDRRRRPAERYTRCRDQLRTETGGEHASWIDAVFLRARGVAGQQHAVGPGTGAWELADAVGGMYQQQLHRTLRQSHRQVRRLRRRVGRSDREGSPLAWGSAGKTDVKILTFAGAPDQTILKDYALKLNGRASNAIRAGYTFWYGDKIKFGRGAGATRPPETTTNQKGPTKMNKGEASFTLGNSVFLVGRYAQISGEFQLAPQGGLEKSVYVDDGGVNHNSYYNYSSTRPQKVASGDGSYFRGAHEVKFGLRVEEIRRPVDHVMARVEDCDNPRWISGNAVEGDPRLRVEHGGQVRQRLHRRHDLVEARDDQPGHPMGSVRVVGAPCGGAGGAGIGVHRSGRPGPFQAFLTRLSQHGDAAPRHQLFTR